MAERLDVLTSDTRPVSPSPGVTMVVLLAGVVFPLEDFEVPHPAAASKKPKSSQQINRMA
jgi:hypothetical protein